MFAVASRRGELADVHSMRIMEEDKPDACLSIGHVEAVRVEPACLVDAHA